MSSFFCIFKYAGFGIKIAYDLSMNDQDSICPKCLKPLKPRSGAGFFTVFFKTAVGSDTPGVAKKDPATRICTQCGKRIEEKKAGSLTQWVFSENI